MPATYHNRVERAYGPDCVFAVTDWSQFLSHLDDNAATVTGTLQEVATPFGVGLRVAAANSYLEIDWHGIIPLLTNARSIFARVYYPVLAVTYFSVSWGGNANRNGFTVGYADWSGGYLGGFYGVLGSGGIRSVGWASEAATNAGITGGARKVYGQGLPVYSGVNGANGITTYSHLTIFRGANTGAAYQCPVGTIIQEVLIFNTVRPAADILRFHNAGLGL